MNEQCSSANPPRHWWIMALWVLNKLRWIRYSYNVKCMSHSEMPKKTLERPPDTLYQYLYWIHSQSPNPLVWPHSTGTKLSCFCIPAQLWFSADPLRGFCICRNTSDRKKKKTTTAWLPYISAQTWTHFDSSISPRTFVFTESSFEGMMRFRSG